jgi:hypothetical protein
VGTCRQSRRRWVKRLDGEGGSDFEVPKYLVPTSQALGWGAEAVSWIEWMSWMGNRRRGARSKQRKVYLVYLCRTVLCLCCIKR